MNVGQIVIIVVTALVAIFASREAFHSLKRLSRSFRDSVAENKIMNAISIVWIATLALAHGIYYWIITFLLVNGVPIGH